MDITKFKPAPTSFLHLKSPVDEELLFDVVDGQKVAVGINFHGPGSAAYEAANSRRTNRSLVRSKKKAELTADLLRTDNVGYLADITASFENVEYPMPAGHTGEDLYKALYGDREYGWVVDQATVFLADWANFTKSSAAS